LGRFARHFRKRRASLRRSRFVRLTVRQTLASRAFYGKVRAFPVADAERNAVAIMEIKLRQIAVQVHLRAVLIDALHAALEDRIVAFDRVDRDDLVAFIADVFVLRVIDGLMVETFDIRDVPVHFVGRQARLIAQVGANDRQDFASANAVNVEAAGSATAPIGRASQRPIGSTRPTKLLRGERKDNSMPQLAT
jgi:hypothetical protein